MTVINVGENPQDDEDDNGGYGPYPYIHIWSIIQDKNPPLGQKDATGY